MAKQETRRGARIVPADELLAKLPGIGLEKKQLSQQLRDIPLETQLLSLADISIERETEGLKEILGALNKL